MKDNMNTHEEQGESQEHVDAMVAKGEQLEANNNPNQEERPDWLPEKFKNVEQMAEAYSNLEKKMGEGISTGNVGLFNIGKGYHHQHLLY